MLEVSATFSWGGRFEAGYLERISSEKVGKLRMRKNYPWWRPRSWDYSTIGIITKNADYSPLLKGGKGYSLVEAIVVWTPQINEWWLKSSWETAIKRGNQ
jgi:hypothetical protein